MLPTLVNDKHIISIDLGTTYSGIAHSVKGVDPICHIYSNHINATKTRTCILYDQKNRICGIGSPAYDKYFLLSEAEQKNYYLIMGPKKVLFDNPDSDAIICENGKSFKVVDVLADFLTKLIEEPMNAYSLQVSDVHWIFSVPANWERQHVLVLRHALFKAGMIDRIDEEDCLTFLLEPESAAVHVLKKQTINNNEKYLVMDLGGGTVDWTAVENQNQKLKTSRYSDAINAGSSLINDKIIEIIKNKMGTYSVHLTSQLVHDIDRKWEDIKLHLQNFDADVYLRLDNVSPDLAQCPLIKRKAIILSSDELKKAFYPIFDSIIDFTQTIVDKERFDKIVCVGGFASCGPLIERIKQEFSSECEILVPDFAVQSVLLGGAYLGRDPSLITSRRSKYGYGIESEVEFDSKRHPISKMKKCPGSRIPVVCEGIYTPIIAHNQEVKKGFNVEKRFTKNQNENVIIIKVYSTTAPRVSYVDDPCCVIKETMRVDVSGLQQGEVFRVQFSIDNSDGMNQLHIAVVPDDIGKRVTTTINFDTVFRVNHF